MTVCSLNHWGRVCRIEWEALEEAHSQGRHLQPRKHRHNRKPSSANSRGEGTWVQRLCCCGACAGSEQPGSPPDSKITTPGV